jgi:predicted O-linked N-acetylglucosamine transferase (SPINDLY family)
MSTGIPGVDYWLADEAGVPTNPQEVFQETVIRLPQFLVFQPPPAAPPVAPLPAARNGFITFGSFANTFKLNDELFAAWAAILARVPESRLVLKSEPLSDAPTRALVDTRLRRAGLPMDRVIILPRTPGLAAHLARYGEIDISLDTFPYTFGNTALESLWMGVPVVSLAGSRFAGRITFSILQAAGFHDLAAFDAAGYAQKAVELARDTGALAAWRGTARERIAASALMDYAGHTRALEQAYREAWRRWCAS